MFEKRGDLLIKPFIPVLLLFYNIIIVTMLGFIHILFIYPYNLIIINIVNYIYGVIIGEATVLLKPIKTNYDIYGFVIIILLFISVSLIILASFKIVNNTNQIKQQVIYQEVPHCNETKQEYYSENRCWIVGD